MLLHCVRHGESLFNIEGRIQGQTDSRLSPLGEKQAAALAKFVKDWPIQAVYSSPLARASQTADPVAKALGMPLIHDDRLKELDAGVFEGLLPSELDVQHAAAHARWRSQDPDFRLPDGESRRDLMVRGEAALLAIRAAGHDRAMVVAHGGVLAGAFKALLGIPAERNPFTLLNASISTLSWEKDFKLLSLNELVHLRLANCELATRTGEL